MTSFKPLRLLLLVMPVFGSAPVTAGNYDLPDVIQQEDFLPVDMKKAQIGQLLFYDKILSGNRNISCGTCHHHDLGGADGLSLGIGEGGDGVGPERLPGSGETRIKKRIPRSAPALWNLGHRSVHTLFHDGRLEISDLYGNGFNSPAQERLPEGLDNILAAQAVFPLTARFEMAGDPAENEVAGAINDRIDAAWPLLAKRVRQTDAYGDLFIDAFDDVGAASDVTIVEIANALAAFMALEWRNYDSPFDAFLAGDETALTEAQANGRDLFYGKAECASCHSGPLLTDQKFHALGLPAFGPGRTRPFDPIPRDVGRMGESDRVSDAYRFRTPSLRNVELTAPYGHNGAYPTLDGMIRHHANPGLARSVWQQAQAQLPVVTWLEDADFILSNDVAEMTRQALHIDMEPMDLSDSEFDSLVQFMLALTGATARQRPLGVPKIVPSGLPVDR